VTDLDDLFLRSRDTACGSQPDGDRQSQFELHGNTSSVGDG
jgi:hypothetical protein